MILTYVMLSPAKKCYSSARDDLRLVEDFFAYSALQVVDKLRRSLRRPVGVGIDLDSGVD